MKRISWKMTVKALLMVCLISLCMMSVTVSAASIKLNKTEATLYKDQTITLKAIPVGISGNVKWSSSKKSVATVSKAGKITAKKAGKTTITAKIGKTKAKCTVTVKKPTIKLSQTKLTLYADDKKTLTATVKGKSPIVRWTSSKKSVATVSGSGTITAKKSGTAIITAKANGVKVTCKVTVKKGYSEKKVIKGLKKYIEKEETPNYYYYEYGKEGNEYVYWVTFTGPDMKMKYYVNYKNGKIYEKGPAFGIDMWLGTPKKRLVANIKKYL